MKSTLFFTVFLLPLAAGVFAAEPSPPPAEANSASIEPLVLTIEGAIPLDLSFKLVAKSAGNTLTGDGVATYASPDDSKLHFVGTLSAVKDGYRLDYVLTLRVPLSSATSAINGNSLPAKTTIRTVTLKASVILQPGQSLIVSNTNDKAITMTLAKAVTIN